MSEVIDNLLVSLGLDTSDFDSSIKNVNKSTKQMETAFNGAKKALALSEKGVEDYNKAIKAGESVITQYSSKIDVLKTAYTEAENKLKGYVQQQKELPNQIAQAESKLKELAQTLGKSSDEYKKAENELKTYKQQLANMDSTINGAVNNMRSLENQIQSVGNKMSSAENEVQQFRTELEQVGQVDLSETESAFSGLSDALGGVDIGDFTGEIGGLDGAMGLLSKGAVGAGVAIAGMITASVIGGAKDYSKVITDLEINMGLTEGKAKDLYQSIQQFSDGGYNIESVSEAVQLLSQRFKMSDEEMKNVSQGMSVLNGYGFENADMVRFMTMAYDNWGMSANDALGMIIEGQQSGMNIAGDFMDTLIEYTPIFGQMGVDGSDAFNLISSAMQATGMDSDKVADMMKELTLTITDGSDASADALASVGIDVDDLTNRIDSGQITMSGAFKEVATAILGIQDETTRATALQDIFKGTVEYGNQTVLESWVNAKTGANDYSGAVEQVTTAYENSYEASQQDFSNSWNELTQTIGSGVLPILTQVVDSMKASIDGISQACTLFGLDMQIMANQLKAFFQECAMGILELGATIFPSWKSTLDNFKTSHDETITYIQGKEQEKANAIKGFNDELVANNATIQNQIKNDTTTAQAGASQAVVDGMNKSKSATSDASSSIKSDMTGAFDGIGNVALTETGKIPQATQQNLANTSQMFRQFGTDTYVNTRQSFSKLEQAIKTSMTGAMQGASQSMSKLKTNIMQDATTTYNQSQKSFKSLEQSAKSSFSSLYNGCKSSMSSLKSSVIGDWNSMRSTIQNNPIKGKITMEKQTIFSSITKKPETQSLSLFNNSIESMSRLKADNLDYAGSTYRASKSASRSSNDSSLKEQNNLLKNILNVLMSDKKTIEISNNINLDGRQIAKGTARYINEEITSMNTRKTRLAGSIVF